MKDNLRVNDRVLAVLTLAFSALLQGCIGSGPYYVDERFTADEEARIEEAASMWGDATGGVLHVDLVFGAHVDVTEVKRNAIVKTGSRAVFSRFPDQQSETRPAFYHPGSSFESSLIVVIADRIGDGLLRSTVGHEMGHSFGLQHVPEANALMYENLEEDTTKCVTEDDLNEARRHIAFATDHPCERPSD